jgi:MSHA biogenesis protein MshK
MRNGLRLLAIAALIAAAAAGRVLAGDLHDPMRPSGVTPSAATSAAPRPAAVSSLKLEGVIAGAQRVAIINGRLVRAGDTVAGARVLEISAHSVRCERAGKILTLTLPVANANTGVRVARSNKDKPSEASP